MRLAGLLLRRSDGLAVIVQQLTAMPHNGPGESYNDLIPPLAARESARPGD
jgi:hypothetical protein